MNDAVELRVLHGPQAGARLPLQAGQAYRIGTGDGCDIVLGGAQVAPEHALLSVDENGITIVPLQGAVGTLAGALDADGAALPLGTVLRLGLVKLTVAQADDEWLPDESLQPVEAPEPDAASETIAPEDPVLDAVPAKDDARPAKNMRSTHRRLQRRSRHRVVMGMSALAVLAATWSVLAFFGVNPVKADASVRAASAAASAASGGVIARVDATAAVAELVKAFPHGKLEPRRQADGTWVIEGRLKTDEERQILREAASALAVPVELKVIVNQDRIDAVKRFAQESQVPERILLRVEAGQGDVLRVVGAASTAEQAAALQQKGRQELAAFEPVEYDIADAAQLREKFTAMLRAAGLEGKVRAVKEEPQLVMRAVFTPQETRTFEAAFADFARQYGSVLPISMQVQPERDVVAGQIAAVVGGAFPYVVTTTGQRVAPGGSLAGHTLIAVRDGEIELSEGLRVRYGN